jgi:hypothetical protein
MLAKAKITMAMLKVQRMKVMILRGMLTTG